MEFAAWEPIYERIVADFGFNPAGDRLARDYLDNRVQPFDLDRLDFEGRHVAIAGGSETLEGDFESVKNAERTVAVSSAVTVFEKEDLRPDLVVTDLDGSPETAASLSERGVPIAVHAHADNVLALRTWLPKFDQQTIIGTTQVEPTRRVINRGGFTDGDRAAFLADSLGAGSLSFPGWQFDDPTVDEIKRRKLLWAAKLLHCLEGLRGERFDLLDGWRGRLSDFPDGTDWECSNTTR